MTLSLIGLLVVVPFIKRVLVSPISLLTFVMVTDAVDDVVDVVFVVVRDTGTMTTLFQLGDGLAPLALYMDVMRPEMFRNV